MLVKIERREIRLLKAQTEMLPSGFIGGEPFIGVAVRFLAAADDLNKRAADPPEINEIVT